MRVRVNESDKEKRGKTMKTALVIMAAGMGSRFGGGIKQLEHVGPNGEIIVDYSIYDAKRAGFDKVVFIIRKDIEKAFHEIIGDRISKQIEVEYVYQELDALPEGYTCPAERSKPWGTGHAILSCLGAVKEPFMVINADDYYGKEAFALIHDFLVKAAEKDSKGEYCMAGYVMGNTLSDNGIVTRGLCQVDADGNLLSVEEMYAIERKGDIAVAKNGAGETVEMALNSAVSMNMWGFTPDFLETLKDGFAEFLKDNSENPKAEYLLPEAVGALLRAKKASVKVLPTNDKWFGVTYKEDKEKVVQSLQELIDKGQYPASLY